MTDSYKTPFAPLPGTSRAPRGIFVERWGALLNVPERGHVEHASEVEFLEGALEALFRASRAGWNIYLIGNEEAVYTGRLAKSAWDPIEEKILGSLARQGVRVGRSYPCLLHPEGVAGQEGDSVYLLPNTGAFYHAFHTDGVQLARSWVIGCSNLALTAGWRAGTRQAGVKTGLGLSDTHHKVDSDFVGRILHEVVLTLLAREEAVHP